MGEKETLFLFIITLCLITFSLQPKAGDTSAQVESSPTFVAAISE